MNLSDWVGLYGALSGTLAGLIAWRAYALAKRTAILDGPHIEISHLSADRPEWIYYHIAGPRAEQWEVARVELMWARDIQICRKEMALDSFGEMLIASVQPQGRVLDNPDTPVVLSGMPTPSAQIIFTLRLKADLNIVRRCRIPFR